MTAGATIRDRMLDIVYKCVTCGNCDVSCKVCRYNMEPLEMIHELRFKLVEDGQLLPQHMLYIDHLRKEDNMMLKPKAERGKWAEGLDVKRITNEPAEVVFHAGCRFSYDEELWPKARTPSPCLRTPEWISASWEQMSPAAPAGSSIWAIKVNSPNSPRTTWKPGKQPESKPS